MVRICCSVELCWRANRVWANKWDFVAAVGNGAASWLSTSWSCICRYRQRSGAFTGNLLPPAKPRNLPKAKATGERQLKSRERSSFGQIDCAEPAFGRANICLELASSRNWVGQFSTARPFAAACFSRQQVAFGQMKRNLLSAASFGRTRFASSTRTSEQVLEIS